MKAKNLFFGALACLAFAACSNDDDAVKNPSAEGDNTYVAVKLVMSGNSSSTTRAWNEDDDTDANYPQGNAAELAVTDATFFFFDELGTSVQEAYKKTGLDAPSDGTENSIDQEYTAYIVVKNVIPAKIAAVLNMPAEAYNALKNVNEATLYKALSSTNYDWTGAESGKFVMSSTTFLNGTSVQTATPVTSANIIKSDEEPTVGNKYTGDVAPVVLPVERLFARVKVTYTKNNNDEDDIPETDLKNGQSTNVDLNNTPNNTADDIEIKPFITGWWLHSTNKDSYLFKDLSTSYSWNDDLTATTNPKKDWWNHEAFNRSYWANAVKDNAGATNFNAYKYSSANLADKYCFENTNADQATTLMLAAILKVKNASNEWEAVDLIQWMGLNFVGEYEFKDYIANYLNEKGYSNGGSDLQSSDLEFVYNNNKNLTANTYDWQTRIALETEVSLQKDGVDVSDVAKTLSEEIGYFRYYNGGQTYYFTKIEHEPGVEATKYAVIRNHMYQININGITGLGTPVPNPSDNPDPEDPEDPTPPVPDPTDPTPEPEYPDPTDPTPDPIDPDQPIDPETPTDDYSSISAKIQVLEYRLVKQDVTIGNQGGAGGN